MTRFVAVIALAAVCGCASSSSNSTERETTAAPAERSEPVDLSADAGTGRVSPLGLSAPDPERMFERALAAHERVTLARAA